MIIKDLPERIKQLALQRQQERYNPHDEDIDLELEAEFGNFDWFLTPEGREFWTKINDGDFSPFYELYGPDPVSDFDTILIDFDGVLTNGKINLTHDGEAFREVHSRDLRAIREMIAKGIRVIIVTASDSPIIKQYAKKVKAELIVCREKGEINTSDFGIFGFVCDDVWDLKLAEKAAKVWTPADADQSLNKFEKLQTKGGDGVIAELVTILWQK